MKYAPIKEFSAERCEILAQIIEQQKHTVVDAENGFNMAAPVHKCGSPCCIGGWASSSLAGGKIAVESGSWSYLTAICHFTGCDYPTAQQLYFGEFSRKPIPDITPQEAAAAIRSLATKRKEQPQTR